jgi:hypothetical protein
VIPPDGAVSGGPMIQSPPRWASTAERRDRRFFMCLEHAKLLRT